MINKIKITLKRAHLLSFLLISLGLFSQDKVITGTVTSSDGGPLPGENIAQKGTGNGVVADFDGNYEITLGPGSQTLVFTYVGNNGDTLIYGTDGLDTNGDGKFTPYDPNGGLS